MSQGSTAGTRPKCADPKTKRRLQLLQYQCKETLRNRPSRTEDQPKAKQKRVDQLEQQLFDLPDSLYSEAPRSREEQRHLREVKQRMAIGNERMATLDEQIEALVAANKKLNDKKIDVTVTEEAEAGGGGAGGSGAGWWRRRRGRRGQCRQRSSRGHRRGW